MEEEAAKEAKKEAKRKAKQAAKELEEKQTALDEEAAPDEKHKKQKTSKLVPSDDSKLDRLIAEREAKLKAQNNGEDPMEGVEETKPQPLTKAHSWNAQYLSGGADRQDKFARLLGAGKADKKEGSAKNPEDAAKAEKKARKAERKAARELEAQNAAKAVELQKIQQDLERQYDTGMRMKHNGGSKKRGLGA